MRRISIQGGIAREQWLKCAGGDFTCPNDASMGGIYCAGCITLARELLKSYQRPRKTSFDEIAASLIVLFSLFTVGVMLWWYWR